MTGFEEYRKRIKELAKKIGCPVRDLLALTPNRDPFYIRKNNEEQARWFKEVWEREGEPEIHPRGLYYRILGKGYRTRDGKAFLPGEKAWREISGGGLWACILGLVPRDIILDEKNPPADYGYFGEHSEFEPVEVFPHNDVVGIEIEPRLVEDSTDEVIERQVEHIMGEAFDHVSYDVARLQPYYCEVWAEKSRVIPRDILPSHFTTRNAGGGEMSHRMCWDAVQKAKSLGKPLVVFMLTDFDPKGHDMPKSVARKVELETKKAGVEAHAIHIAVTENQCRKYALPTSPAKTPKGLGTGAKAYETHKRIFMERAGQLPVEINALSDGEPEEFRRIVKEAISPYFDPELDSKVEEAIENAKAEAEEKIRDALEERRRRIQNARRTILPLLNKFRKMFEKTKKGLKIEEALDDYSEALEIPTQEILSEVDLALPEPEVRGPSDNNLLDTRRTFEEQLKAYKRFDIRYRKKKIGRG